MHARSIVVLGASLAALAVVMGAFGAHALGKIVPDDVGLERATGWWTTASHYHLLHAVGLVVVGALGSVRGQRWTASVFVVGILVFSGSLYAMALGAPRVLGMVTPFGGLALIAGWVLLATFAVGSRP